ncbi:trypsin-like peptidase domain-containing protein [Roseomonas sp. AR75]|uniref:trypsin-like peptidase domain-containing protein n=1 Tax=Roseomonas sp. AR75 TaxID=2562311 RepID=UPI0010BFD464|nr:trypsin-like peptidase domain-containing protein [Roseomonas sp. AR75]
MTPRRPWPVLLALLPLAACDDPPPAPPPERPAAIEPAAPAEATATPALSLPDFERLAEQVMPAVVSIAVTQEAGSALLPQFRGTPYERYFRDRFGGQRTPPVVGAGSGFIVDASGLIVTANHVVGNASRVTVSLVDGTELPARILGTDELTDLAVLQVSAPRALPHVAFGTSGVVNIGQWVLAAGNPFGLGGSVSSGIVSALGRRIGLGPFDDFIQTDAPINPGNSGGPLFNLAGEVIGVNTAIYSPSGASAGIGFATPSDLAAPVVARLQTGRRVERGWLGVSVGDAAVQENTGVLGQIFGPDAPRRGVAISAVVPGSPAARAGLRPGDVVLEIGGERVPDARALLRRIAGVAPGQQVALRLIRDGREQQVTVRVTARPAD